MSDQSGGPGWWLASDGRWYPPLPPAPPGVPHGSRVRLWVGLAVGGLALFVVGMIGVAVWWGDVQDSMTVAGRGDGVEVTLEEYDRIEVGMTLAEVERIVGGPGALTSSAGEGEMLAEIYSWDGNGWLGANANVSFSAGLVIAKAQFGLR